MLHYNTLTNRNINLQFQLLLFQFQITASTVNTSDVSNDKLLFAFSSTPNSVHRTEATGVM